jgi:hypothetical protein
MLLDGRLHTKKKESPIPNSTNGKSDHLRRRNRDGNEEMHRHISDEVRPAGTPSVCCARNRVGHARRPG